MDNEELDVKRLKKLRRIDLLELLLDEREENERLREKIRILEAELQNQDADFAEAGTLAEAALRLNRIFADADAAAAAYLKNIRRITEKGGAFDDEQKLMAGRIPAVRRRPAPGSGNGTA